MPVFLCELSPPSNFQSVRRRTTDAVQLFCISTSDTNFVFFLLTEASFAVQARAIKNYCNIYDPSTLAFKEGDIIKVSVCLSVPHAEKSFYL